MGLYLLRYTFEHILAPQKHRAPAPPNISSTASIVQQSIYGTLPHAPRNSQNMDAIDYRVAGKSQPDTYGTLPHLRSLDYGKGTSAAGIYHYDNKVYERFEPLITATQQAKYDKHKVVEHGARDENAATPGAPMVMTTFGHKRSPSGESLNRNLHLPGAKLVLPIGGEMPTLKPVDKNLMRPKLPPPGPPPGTSSSNGQGGMWTKV